MYLISCCCSCRCFSVSIQAFTVTKGVFKIFQFHYIMFARHNFKELEVFMNTYLKQLLMCKKIISQP